MILSGDAASAASPVCPVCKVADSSVLTSAAAEVEESHDQDKGKTRGVFDVSTQMLGPHLAPTYIRASLYLAYVTSPVSPSKGWKGQKHPRLRNIRRGNELGD